VTDIPGPVDAKLIASIECFEGSMTTLDGANLGVIIALTAADGEQRRYFLPAGPGVTELAEGLISLNGAVS
jgi:hypothetical protein